MLFFFCGTEESRRFAHCSRVCITVLLKYKVVKVLDTIINWNKLEGWTLCNCQKLLDSSGLAPVSVASSQPFAPFSKGPWSHPTDLTLSGSCPPTSPVVSFLVVGCWSKPLTMINLMGRGKLGTFQTRNLCFLLKSPFCTVVSRECVVSWNAPFWCSLRWRASMLGLDSSPSFVSSMNTAPGLPCSSLFGFSTLPFVWQFFVLSYLYLLEPTLSSLYLLGLDDKGKPSSCMVFHISYDRLMFNHNDVNESCFSTRTSSWFIYIVIQAD